MELSKNIGKRVVKMKRIRSLFCLLMAMLFVCGAAGVSAFAETVYGTLTLDTRSYVMAPGDIYDFRAKVEGGDLRQDEVVVSDSRTGSVVQLARVAGTDKYRITAVNEGVCYVVAEVRGTHASIRVEVKEGAQAQGEAVRSITKVPVGQGSAAEPAETPQDTTASQPESSAADTPAAGQKIYCTPTGSKYHYDPHCNSGKYEETTLEAALAAGLEPCKKCVLGDYNG